jgi:hypothetical protein
LVGWLVGLVWFGLVWFNGRNNNQGLAVNKNSTTLNSKKREMDNLFLNLLHAEFTL